MCYLGSHCYCFMFAVRFRSKLRPWNMAESGPLRQSISSKLLDPNLESVGRHRDFGEEWHFCFRSHCGCHHELWGSKMLVSLDIFQWKPQVLHMTHTTKAIAKHEDPYMTQPPAPEFLTMNLCLDPLPKDTPWFFHLCHRTPGCARTHERSERRP